MRVYAVAMIVGMGILAALGEGENPAALRKVGTDCLETAKWQAEIDAASSRGGGRVTVPTGVHYIGGLVLKDNVELHLEEGAVLKAVYGYGNYRRWILPYSEGDWMAIVAAVGVTNVAITGKGEINGQGYLWHRQLIDVADICWEGFRPRGLLFADSAKIRLEGFTLRDTGCWGCVFKRCDGVHAKGVTIDGHGNENNDGFDIEAKNVVIEGCDVDSSDDAICVKSNDPHFIVENVLITNCVARSQCNALKIGTATHGTVRNVTYVDCRTEAPRRNFTYIDGPFKGRAFRHTRVAEGFPYGTCIGGINVDGVDGGAVQHIIFRNIEVHGCRVPIFVRGGHRTRRVCGIAPGNQNRLEDVLIENITGEACSEIASSISGVPQCRPNRITLRHVRVTCRGKGDSDAPCVLPDSRFDGSYPEATMYSRLRLPSYGLFIDKADNVTLEDVTFPLRAGDRDSRPAVHRTGR